MEFWAIENADDNTLILFGIIVFSCITLMIGVVTADWIKKIKNGKREKGL